MKKIIPVIAMGLVFSAQAEELIEGNKYRTKSILIVKDSKAADANSLKVGAQSKFIVFDNLSSDAYAVKFTKLYPHNEIKAARTVDDYKSELPPDVIEDEIYYLEKSQPDDVAVEKKVERSFGGIVSGPLIVPFKYRLDDKTMAGDATVGYYAGYGFDVPISDEYFTVTPFLSAGLTQVSVLKEAEDGSTSTDSKSGFTWATGILIQNWDSVNIGIVYGQDRIGDQSWEHEGEGWVSISIGWEL